MFFFHYQTKHQCARFVWCINLTWLVDFIYYLIYPVAQIYECLLDREDRFLSFFFPVSLEEYWLTFSLLHESQSLVQLLPGLEERPVCISMFGVQDKEVKGGCQSEIELYPLTSAVEGWDNDLKGQVPGQDLERDIPVLLVIFLSVTTSCNDLFVVCFWEKLIEIGFVMYKTSHL